MANNTPKPTLASLIRALRNATERDSISPESLGYLLGRIAEKLTAGDAPVLPADSPNPLSALQPRAQIFCEVVDDCLYVYGSKRLLDAGYVPYLFRHSHRQNRDKIHLSPANKPTRGAHSKGWHLFGSMHTIRIVDNLVELSTNLRCELHQEAADYETLTASALANIHTDHNGYKVVSWGKRQIELNNRFRSNERMLRLRYGIGFALPCEHGRRKVNPLNLVSNLAEFTVVYTPENGKVCLSR